MAKLADQGVPSIPASPCVHKESPGQIGQTQRVVQFPKGEQPSVAGDVGSAKFKGGFINSEILNPLHITSPAGTWTGVGAGNLFSAGLQGTTLYMWGLNNTAQLGANYSASVPQQMSPQAVAGTWSTVALGDAYTLALDGSGHLFAWGSHITGHLGVGTLSGAPATIICGSIPCAQTPTAVTTPAGSWQMVTAGTHQGAGIMGGALYTWGWNTVGELGIGATGGLTPV